MSTADLVADNGVIHFVTDVIYPLASEDIPSRLTKDGRFVTLLAAVEAADLGQVLASGEWTSGRMRSSRV